jgi:hypothetical protein
VKNDSKTTCIFSWKEAIELKLERFQVAAAAKSKKQATLERLSWSAALRPSKTAATGFEIPDSSQFGAAGAAGPFAGPNLSRKL